MSKIIVSLVSKQTIPNVTFIKANPSVIKLVFITTEKMEEKEKTNWILKSTGASGGERIIVPEGSISGIKNKLSESFSFNENDEILVNLTGGNKNMFLASYEFFKEQNLQKQNNIKMYYLNEGSNSFNMIFPSEQRECVDGGYCNLKEYLTAYSIGEKARMLPLQEFEKTREFYENTFESEKNGIHALHEIVNDKQYKGKLKEKLKHKDFLNTLSANQAVGNLFNKTFGGIEFSEQKIKYLRGGWFEEYVYFIIKRGLGLDNEQIYLGLSIKDESLPGKTANNEIDVIFIYKNKINIIECKTGYKDEKGKSILQDVLYKQSALQKSFGLTAKSFLFLPNALSGSESQKERAQVYNIGIIDDKEMLLDEEKFKIEFLAKFFA